MKENRNDMAKKESKDNIRASSGQAQLREH